MNDKLASHVTAFSEALYWQGSCQLQQLLPIAHSRIQVQETMFSVVRPLVLQCTRQVYAAFSLFIDQSLDSLTDEPKRKKSA